MSTERRESLRTRMTLPFEWVACAADTPSDELCRRFDLPGFVRFHGRLGELGAEFSRALHDVRDPATVGALEVLDAKLQVFEEALGADAAIPAPRTLELATDGLGFDEAEPLAQGTWLGIHLVLPVAYHLVCRAQVSHCQLRGSGHRVGARLLDLDAAAARRLTRLVISSREVG